MPGVSQNDPAHVNYKISIIDSYDTVDEDDLSVSCLQKYR